MSALLVAGIVALAGMMYNVPLMRRVEMYQLNRQLHNVVYCQEQAVSELIGHIGAYSSRNQQGVVVLFLAGPEGTGKTLTVDNMIHVSPSWLKLVGTHQQGELNQLSEADLIAAIRRSVHSSKLNFVFFDDIPNLREGDPIVETRLMPVLRELKFEKSLVFVVVVMTTENPQLPAFIANEYESQLIQYQHLDRSCVEQCINDMNWVFELREKVDVDAMLAKAKIEFKMVNGREVSKNGCKMIPITVALYQTELEQHGELPESHEEL